MAQKKKRKYTRKTIVEKSDTINKIIEIDKPIVKEKLVESRSIYGIEGKFLHIKVGNSDRPADQNDIDLITGQMTDLLEQHKVKCLVFVTHHAVQIDVIGGDASNVMETIEHEEVVNNEQSKKGNI